MLSLKRLGKKVLVEAFLCALLVPLSAPAQPESLPAAPLQGTFIQLNSAHRHWMEDDWKRLFNDFQSLGLSQLILQWTVYEDTVFYLSAEERDKGTPPLEAILQRADAAGLRVRVGLVYDPQYWEKIGQRGIASVSAYLRQLRYRSLRTARELLPRLIAHPSFCGWYIPEEIDDVNWLEPERRQVLFEHFAELTAALRELAPQAEIALSGFSNANTSPLAFEKFYRGLLQATTAEVVLLQDGIGVQKLDLENLELYLAAMRRAVDAHGRDLQVVVELFQQVEGQPLDDQPFKAIPAPLGRIRRQIELASEYSTAGVMAFSVPDYMSSSAGPEAQRLLQHYLKTFSAVEN